MLEKYVFIYVWSFVAQFNYSNYRAKEKKIKIEIKQQLLMILVTAILSSQTQPMEKNLRLSVYSGIGQGTSWWFKDFFCLLSWWHVTNRSLYEKNHSVKVPHYEYSIQKINKLKIERQVNILKNSCLKSSKCRRYPKSGKCNRWSFILFFFFLPTVVPMSYRWTCCNLRKVGIP